MSQGYPNLEYIIIDGGSTDHTLEIIKKYEQYLTYWVSESDQGQSDAINKGLKHVTGDIFNWINSDDYYEPEVFQKVNHYFSESDCDILCGREWVFNDVTGTRILKPGSTVKDRLEETIEISHIDQPCTFWRYSVFNELTPLNNSFHYLMDAEIWVRYLLTSGQDRIFKVDDILTNFRIHNSSKTVVFQDSFLREREMLKMITHGALGVPDYIINRLYKRSMKDVSIGMFSNILLSSTVNKSFFRSSCAFKTYGVFLAEAEYSKARMAFKDYLVHGSPKWDIKLVKLIILLFLIPDFLLRKLYH